MFMMQSHVFQGHLKVGSVKSCMTDPARMANFRVCPESRCKKHWTITPLCLFTGQNAGDKPLSDSKSAFLRVQDLGALAITDV
jgi:hypothetical protein